MGFIYLNDLIFQVASQMSEESAEWQILEELIDERIVQLQYFEHNDSHGVSDHHLAVIEELIGDGQQWEVVGARIDEEFDCVVVDLECQGFEEGNEDVD